MADKEDQRDREDKGWGEGGKAGNLYTEKEDGLKNLTKEENKRMKERTAQRYGEGGQPGGLAGIFTERD
jgi:hypothetical protein